MFANCSRKLFTWRRGQTGNSLYSVGWWVAGLLACPLVTSLPSSTVRLTGAVSDISGFELLHFNINNGWRSHKSTRRKLAQVRPESNVARLQASIFGVGLIVSTSRRELPGNLSVAWAQRFVLVLKLFACSLPTSSHGVFQPSIDKREVSGGDQSRNIHGSCLGYINICRDL